MEWVMEDDRKYLEQAVRIKADIQNQQTELQRQLLLLSTFALVFLISFIDRVDTSCLLTLWRMAGMCFLLVIILVLSSYVGSMIIHNNALRRTSEGELLYVSNVSLGRVGSCGIFLFLIGVSATAALAFFAQSHMAQSGHFQQLGG